MIPRKAKQTLLSLVTSEPSKDGGPPKSTQSTVSAGDWDAHPASSASTQSAHSHSKSAEPNSGAADPWMVVSGATFLSNPVQGGVSSTVSTPMTAREEQLNRLPPLQLLERNDDTDPVLDVDIAHQIRLELPRKLRNATKWNLVYSSDQHGISMTTLYHRCRGKGPMILAVKDTYDCVFGAFINEELKPNLTYYGTGEWQAPASPTLGPSPLPSPSPLQLFSTTTTPATGRSPAPSPAPLSNIQAPSSRAGQMRENRRQDLLQAMSDQLSMSGGARSPSPSPLSSQHQVNSPSFSPSLRPVGVSPAPIPTSTPIASSALTSTPPSHSNDTSATGPSVLTPRRKKKQKVVQFWQWSGKNDYMVLSEPGFIGLGGGDGKFGLWIHSDLERGHSARCATFENEPLAAACRQPIRVPKVDDAADAVTPLSSQASQATPSPAITLHGVGGVHAVKHDKADQSLRSASPSDREEFYCQTIEIWSLVL
ncbi:oxidation resistance protein 1 [Podila epigama]|nr:oxidation resistance protein 1 [Podila epigama]